MQGRYAIDQVVPGDVSAVFIDDRPEGLPEGATVIPVSPYLAENPYDRELATVARAAGTVLSSLG